MMILIDGKTCSGKSFWAKKLSEALNYKLINLDEEVKKMYEYQDIIDDLTVLLELDNFSLDALRKILLYDEIKKNKLETYIFAKLYNKFKNEKKIIIEGYQASKIFKENAVCFYLTCNTNIRRKRYEKRNAKMKFEDLDKIQKNIVKIDNYTFTYNTEMESDIINSMIKDIKRYEKYR